MRNCTRFCLSARVPTRLCLPGACVAPCGLSLLSLADMTAVASVVSALQASGVVAEAL